jgi:hypothetical protein
MYEQLLGLSRQVSECARTSLGEIAGVTRATRMLAINARIEAAHAGDHGLGFAVVADEVRTISDRVEQIARSLNDQLKGHFDQLDRIGATLAADARGTRAADLSLNLIEIIDRNLYERSCDVRWWATDAAVVAAAASADEAAHRHCSGRLGVILDAYTVYLDIWVADAHGKVIATGRPQKFPAAAGADVSQTTWFRAAMATRDGGEFAVDDVAPSRELDGRLVAAYATAVRDNAAAHGRPVGAIGIFFDWQTQAQAVVDGVRLTPEERERTRCLLVDRHGKVLASSDRQGVLTETIALPPDRPPAGHATLKDGTLMAWALTPGYETYKGLGWHGVILQQPQK